MAAKKKNNNSNYYFTKRQISEMQIKHEVSALYRYRSGGVETVISDEFGSRNAIRQTLICDEFPVIKETPCGFWIDALEWKEGKYQTRRRFVLKNSQQSFASPIRSEALRAYIYRKQKQLTFIEQDWQTARLQLNEAKRQIDLMDDENKANIYIKEDLICQSDQEITDLFKD